MGVASHTREWLQGLIEAAFPISCVECDALIEHGPGPFCDVCHEEAIDSAGDRCPRCALPVGPFAWIEDGCAWCGKRALGFDEAMALGPYEGPIRTACLRLKHKQNAWIARGLADLLVEVHGERARSWGDVVVTSVPLHWGRRLERGFNQSDELAERLAQRLGAPTARALTRVRKTRKLAALSRTERAEVMRGAFRVRNDARVRGRTIVLVDDIMTTGATCGAAARALKAAGAHRVVALVVARAEGLA